MICQWRLKRYAVLPFLPTLAVHFAVSAYLMLEPISIERLPGHASDRPSMAFVLPGPQSKIKQTAD
jgi:hypothetical protein